MTSLNQELYQKLMDLRGDEIFNWFNDLDEDVYEDFRDIPVEDEDIDIFLQKLYSGSNQISPEMSFGDGPPTKQEIVDLYRWKLFLFQSIRRLERHEQKEFSDSTLKRFTALCLLDPNNKKQVLQLEIMSKCGFSNNDNLDWAELSQDIEFLQQKAQPKVYAQKNAKQQKHLSLNANIREKIAAMSTLREDVSKVQQHIAAEKIRIQKKITSLLGEIQRKKADSLNPQTTKASKEANTKSIEELNAQITLLRLTETKLDPLSNKVELGSGKSAENIDKKFKRLFCKTSASEDSIIFWQEEMFDEAHDNVVCYKIEDGQFKYECFEPVDILEGKTGINRKVVKGSISLSSIGLNENSDFSGSDPEVNSRILKALSIKGHKFPTYPAFAKDYAGSEVDEDERYFNSLVESSGLVIAEIQEDLKRCEAISNYTQKVAQNPKSHMHNNVPVNSFVDVMSLVDMQTFDNTGEPYFHDEIVSKNTGQANPKDYRTRFGVEGKVASRGVYLAPNEVKRSTYYKYETDRKTGQTTKKASLVVETSFVKSADGKDTVQILNKSKNLPPIGSEEMQLLAFKMAKERLLHCRAGDARDKIVLTCDGDNAQHRGLASHIYAALLMLSSAHEGDDNYIKLHPRQIEINGKNCEKPGFWEMTLHSKRDFYQKYFTDPTQRTSMRKEFTTTYRDKRKEIKDNSAIKEDAGQDHLRDLPNQTRTMQR